MRISAILFIALLFYGLFFLWPIKRSIYKKHGKILSNVQLSKLADDGDIDAINLKRKSKYFLVLGIIFVLLFIIEKYGALTI
ncbi:hypothetical protein DBR37_05805 [Herminiimonas sp. KBW02]|nr:hypothetical protein DBR37_05805 [Herminiimonas sp. KBW02]